MRMITRRHWLATAGSLLVGGSWRSISHAGEQVVNLVCRKFAFEPERITVRRGMPVVLQLSSIDVPMGIKIAELGVRADMLPGQVTELRFTPEKAGTFTFFCDVFCGDDHELMQGDLVVLAD